jgi:hypothetical protein
MRSCSNNDSITTPSEPITITKVEVRYDTIQIVLEKYTPKWKERIVTKYETITPLIDTVTILQDYYSKYVYNDTIHINTIGYAVINDTIMRNTIFSRNVSTNFLIPTTTVTNTIYINNREWYWGLGLAGLPSQINYVGGELMLKTKKKQIYGFGVGVNQNFEPILSGRMYWKIGK